MGVTDTHQYNADGAYHAANEAHQYDLQTSGTGSEARLLSYNQAETRVAAWKAAPEAGLTASRGMFLFVCTERRRKWSLAEKARIIVGSEPQTVWKVHGVRHKIAQRSVHTPATAEHLDHTVDCVAHPLVRIERLLARWATKIAPRNVEIRVRSIPRIKGLRLS